MEEVEEREEGEKEKEVGKKAEELLQPGGVVEEEEKEKVELNGGGVERTGNVHVKEESGGSGS